MGLNYLVMRITGDLARATHLILGTGTFVVASLLITGGWQQTGYLWTFAYLPYALFLAPPRVSWAWITILLGIDAALLGAASAGLLPMPYTGVQLAFFAASLAVFLFVMWCFQRATLGAEHKAASTAAQAADARDRLAEAQRLANIGSWAWHIPSDTVTWSDELYRIFGMEPTGSPASYEEYLSHVHPDDREHVQRIVERAFTTGEPYVVEHRVAASEDTWVAGTGRIIEVGEDGPIRMAGTAQDISHRKRAEAEQQKARQQQAELEALQSANQFKTAFLNTAAHELATPLTPVKIQLRLLQSRVPEDDALRPGVDILARNLDRLDLLVQDLLDGARLQSDHLRMNLGDVDVAREVRQSLQAHAEQAQQADIQLAADVSKRLLVRGDSVRIAQMLDNLVGNALKFTEAGGAVRLRAYQDGPCAIVMVEDNGIGFAPEAQERLFEPFVQVHESMAKMTSGTGLGLYISRGIALAHGGSLEATSRGPGKGASFALRLPRDGPPI